MITIRPECFSDLSEEGKRLYELSAEKESLNLFAAERLARLADTLYYEGYANGYEAEK